MSKYWIEDWAGNVLWNGVTFSTFQDGWDYIYATDPQPEDSTDGHYYDDYYVMPTKEERA